MPEPRSRRVLTRLEVIPRALPRWWRAWALVVLLTVPHAQPVSAGPLHVVGVPGFYVSGPTPAYSGPPLGQVVADEVTRMLPKIAKGALEVISRNVMREKQAAMGWHGQDALSAAQAGELAAAVGADHLIVGRIDRFSVERSTGTRGGGKYQAHTVLRVQVFDNSQKRFAGSGTGDGVAIGTTQSIAAQQALRQALAAALPRALESLKVARSPWRPSAPSSETVGLLSPR